MSTMVLLCGSTALPLLPANSTGRSNSLYGLALLAQTQCGIIAAAGYNNVLSYLWLDRP